MQREGNEKPSQAVVAAVQLPTVSDAEFDASLTELRELAKTLGFIVVRTFVQKRQGFDQTAYLGVGKREEISAFINDEAEPGGIDAILVDHEISPSQARNLEKETGCAVMDRTMVILEIFHRNARSRAAKAQVEIARLGYMAPRLREAAKLAGSQGRQRSGVGGRGAGESHTELDRRKIRDRIAELQLEIVAMDAERKTQRARRQERQGLAGVALVGYTNAGKSTLMRALTGSEVLVANKLFATLDTTVRTLYPESVPRVLVSDTVGFIKNLPHGLVASFKSTLDEALDASLLLHVIDASDPGCERQREVTDRVLEEIGADAVPRLRVFNKIDHVGDAAAQAEREAELRAQYPDCIVMSARRPDDVAKLHRAIVAFFQQDLVEAEIFLPWSAQEFRGQLYRSCQVLEERADGEGAFFRVRGAADAVGQLQAQFRLPS
ncbi:MAG: GTPase HflX [Azonexus sp.]|nr:GTPase HflX [Betaproteobacteria bacterium]MBK8918582.1 GTPase HflX [Betaproteobacteria bacterium]MBP6034514.1 GTPase HflX [Azonexus sp.]MBP6905054.1 GTPase HflX [Azonexus sp.]